MIPEYTKSYLKALPHATLDPSIHFLYHIASSWIMGIPERSGLDLQHIEWDILKWTEDNQGKLHRVQSLTPFIVLES